MRNIDVSLGISPLSWRAAPSGIVSPATFYPVHAAGTQQTRE